MKKPDTNGQLLCTWDSLEKNSFSVYYMEAAFPCVQLTFSYPRKRKLFLNNFEKQLKIILHFSTQWVMPV